MKAHEKIAANDQQIKTYFRAYDRFWRLSKLLSLKELLKDRNRFLDVYRRAYPSAFFADYGMYVYQNMTNGILADALSELVMYCEDYLSLLKFIRDKEQFIKHTVNYKAGFVDNVASKLRIVNRRQIETLFFLPPMRLVEVCFARDNAGAARSKIQEYDERVGLLAALHMMVINFYFEHKDAHNQYKHGLKIGIGSLGGALNSEELSRRQRESSGSFFVFQNRPAESLTAKQALLIPDISHESVRNNLVSLMNDRNLLHLESVHQIDIENLIPVGESVAALLSFLVANRINNMGNADTRALRISLPLGAAEPLKGIFYDFILKPGDALPTIDDYQMKM